MEHIEERRREQRLHYVRPMYFGDNLKQARHSGQTIDVCSGGLAFTCTGENYPKKDQQITTQFYLWRSEPDKVQGYRPETWVRIGKVLRVDEIDDNNKALHRIAIQFAEPLSYKPVEQKSPPKLSIS